MTEIFNDNNVYIVGAGFSAARGLPLISDFMFALRDTHTWLIGQNRSKEAESVEKVLEFRQKSTPTAYRVQIDLENIEELFSLAAAVDESLTNDIRIAVAATIDYCAATNKVPRAHLTVTPGNLCLPAGLTKNRIESGVRGSAPKYDMPAYGFLVGGLLGILDTARPQAKNAFISFNYDLLIEEALTLLGLPFSYGFSPKSVGHDDSIKGISFRGDAELRVLKLHGSTNWAFPGYQGGKLTVFGSYDDVREKGYTPELIPPTWRKSFDGSLMYVWKEALTQISRATRLVIIGFSVPPTDLHFKYLIAGGLRENVSLREIVFVNPNKDAVEARAEELFGDVERRPRVRTVAIQALQFVGQGALETNSGSVGRTLNTAIQQVFQGY